ncbi:MAG TPA: hypothetical protein VLT61_05715, partial [Anaeromyxobacteraceae bacterium]|nr:hypothetical protein [Anaeromyxobacteraceae bacterium]
GLLGNPLRGGPPGLAPGSVNEPPRSLAFFAADGALDGQASAGVADLFIAIAKYQSNGRKR